MPTHPILNTLRLHGEVNLRKIRTCGNIAGMQPQLEPYAAPTDMTSSPTKSGAAGQLGLPKAEIIQPTIYRYSVIIERAKQLVQLASQTEASMLQALEQRDAEAYGLLKARQDLGVAQAGRRLQDLKLTEARARVPLAQLQHEQALTRAQHYEGLLNDSTSDTAKDEATALNSTDPTLRFLEHAP